MTYNVFSGTLNPAQSISYAPMFLHLVCNEKLKGVILIRESVGGVLISLP